MQVPSQLLPPCQGWSWPWEDNGDTPGSWMEDKGFAPPWGHRVTQTVAVFQGLAVMCCFAPASSWVQRCVPGGYPGLQA